MKVTFQQIKAAKPCSNGWRSLIENNPHWDGDLKTEFPMSSILESNDEEDLGWAIDAVMTRECQRKVCDRIAMFIALRENDIQAVGLLTTFRLRGKGLCDLDNFDGLFNYRMARLLEGVYDYDVENIIEYSCDSFDVSYEELMRIIDGIEAEVKPFILKRCKEWNEGI